MKRTPGAWDEPRRIQNLHTIDRSLGLPWGLPQTLHWVHEIVSVASPPPNLFHLPGIRVDRVAQAATSEQIESPHLPPLRVPPPMRPPGKGPAFGQHRRLPDELRKRPKTAFT